MAYDEKLADRIRAALGPDADVTEKKMFGGLAFLRRGKMFVGIADDKLMVRVGPERYDESLARPHARPMDFTGRPMNGYIFVEAPGCRTTRSVKPWVEQAFAFVATVKPTRRPRRPRPPRRAERRKTR
jgi:TfoX/Sxy family transcriptional regulator of competence genes